MSVHILLIYWMGLVKGKSPGMGAASKGQSACFALLRAKRIDWDK